MYSEAKKVLEKIDHEQLEKLEYWADLDSRHTISAGSIGQNKEEMNEADRAWERLKESTKKAYKEILDLHGKYSEEAIQEASEALKDDIANIDKAFALGDDYPLHPYISAQDY